jgi:hypothetical protein
MMKKAGKEDDEYLIWAYFKNNLMPFVTGLYNKASPKMVVPARVNAVNDVLDVQEFWRIIKTHYTELNEHQVYMLSLY